MVYNVNERTQTNKPETNRHPIFAIEKDGTRASAPGDEFKAIYLYRLGELPRFSIAGKMPCAPRIKIGGEGGVPVFRARLGTLEDSGFRNRSTRRWRISSDLLFDYDN
jgi:hypothetical protein